MSAETEALRAAVADFARAVVAPAAAAAERGVRDPRVDEGLDALGLFGMAAPAALGGSDLDDGDRLVVVDALAEADASVALLVGLHAATVRALRAADPESVPITAAEAVPLFAGRGERATWPSALVPRFALGPIAGGAGVRGIAFVDVPASATTASAPASGLRALGLVDGPVPAASASIDEADPIEGLDEARRAIAATALGVARSAATAALAHAGTRVQFGRPIGHFPAIGAKLADARAAIDALALRVSRGRVDDAVVAHATSVAERIAHDALQVHGGLGYTKDAPVERAFRDAVALRALARAWRGAEGGEASARESLASR